MHIRNILYSIFIHNFDSNDGDDGDDADDADGADDG